MLEQFHTKSWDEIHTPDTQQHALKQLENGHILFFPQLDFSLSSVEKVFLSTEFSDPNSKNISYHLPTKKLWGVRNLTDTQHQQLKSMLNRYSNYSLGLIKSLLPLYSSQIQLGRTSYRPIQISGRKTSPRKDDKRLHVDAFPSAPNQGKRILRVFTNINPNGKDRVWRTGEAFENVAQRFIPQISKPFPGIASCLRALKITKSYRTAYDHYMLRMHDMMKADDKYQQTVTQREIRFTPASSWIVQTDHVSHAAMTGQYVLEQTFYLPVAAMQDVALSPLKILENMLQQKLV